MEPNFLFDLSADFCDRHETTFKLGERCPKCSPREVGRCECGASYYRIEQIGQPCEIQYCRGTVRSTTNRCRVCGKEDCPRDHGP